MISGGSTSKRRINGHDHQCFRRRENRRHVLRLCYVTSGTVMIMVTAILAGPASAGRLMNSRLSTGDVWDVIREQRFFEPIDTHSRRSPVRRLRPAPWVGSKHAQTQKNQASAAADHSFPLTQSVTQPESGPAELAETPPESQSHLHEVMTGIFDTKEPLLTEITKKKSEPSHPLRATEAPQVSASMRMLMVLLDMENHQGIDQNVHDWQVLTSKHVERYWNVWQRIGGEESAHVDVISVETTLLSRLLLTPNLSAATTRTNDTTLPWRQWMMQAVRQSNDTGHLTKRNFSVSHPLLLEYDQTIVYSLSVGATTPSAERLPTDVPLFEKPFSEASASRLLYFRQLASLVNNTYPIQLQSVNLSRQPLSSSPVIVDEPSDDGNDSGTTSVALVIAITVTIIIMCLVLCTCRCD